MAGAGMTYDEALADFWARVQGRYAFLLGVPYHFHTDLTYPEFQFLGRMLNAIEEE